MKLTQLCYTTIISKYYVLDLLCNKLFNVHTSTLIYHTNILNNTVKHFLVHKQVNPFNYDFLSPKQKKEASILFQCRPIQQTQSLLLPVAFLKRR